MKKIKLTMVHIFGNLVRGTELGNPIFAEWDGALLDVNATSPTFNQCIVPEDYKGLVSVWYFGHST